MSKKLLLQLFILGIISIILVSATWSSQAQQDTSSSNLTVAQEQAQPSQQSEIKKPPKVQEPKQEEKPSWLSHINGFLFKILFFDMAFGSIHLEGQEAPVALPFLIMLLIGGAIFFTFWYGWMNIRGFKHSLNIIRGIYSNPKDHGEISHFRALTSALSATVGLGNIAGVAIAIQIGGPGAVFWMLLAAVFGMSTKFSSCTLSQLYRHINVDGSISGGPMYYLDLGLKSMGRFWRPLGKALALLFAVMIMGGAIGGGNMFQSNQSFEAIATSFGQPQWLEAGSTPSWIFGCTLAILVGLVIIGGIKRIGAATSKIVPTMCGLYVAASLYIILSNASQIPEAFGLIFKMAFNDNAAYGGFVGVMVWGIRRASFSNEAGLGSSAIAHAAAKTEEPVREGLVAMLEPFIDTIIVCLMTALVVIITGAWNDPNIPEKAGVALTTSAFATSVSWFPYVLSVCVLLFAYSTMISWCYYGERGWVYLFDHFGNIGLKTVLIFRVIFISAIVVGAVHPLKDVLDFSDAMILSMAFPNIVGSIILAPKVLPIVKDYWNRYKNGEILTYAETVKRGKKG